MLYLVPTPIGNMEDITLRAIRVLKECDALYCEDTRHTGALLKALDIKKPLFACHAHNESARAAEIAQRLQNGDTLAYASDAGMPGISDPGARLVHLCIEQSLPYTVLPGASASLTALVLSGMEAANACFVGFLPRAGKERRERIALLSALPSTLILYESPLRVSATSAELAALWGDRKACLCRELSKLYEECVRGTLGSLAALYEETPPKGECVLLIAGKSEADESTDPRALLASLLAKGLSAKDAAKQVAALSDMPRNEAYALALELTRAQKE